MRKLIGILMALCLLTVFVSSASACIPRPGHPCPPQDRINLPDIQVPTQPSTGNILSIGEVATYGEAGASGICQSTAEVASAYDLTDSGAHAGTVVSAEGDHTVASVEGGSSASSVFTNTNP